MAIAPARPVDLHRGGRRRDAALRNEPGHGAAHARLRRALARACACAAMLAFVPVLTAGAEDVTADEMRSLDERVQSIKSDVLEIAAELAQLEEKLLYPSSTQVAVFVSLDDAYVGDLGSVEIQLDGEAVAHHIYSYEELQALGKGGVQRVYTGNMSTGDHQLVVSVKGATPSGREVSEQQVFTISKETGPKLVGVRLASSESGELKIELGDG